MTSFGAIDLFSGSTSLSGSNLWQTDKNPLNQLDEGIEDVIGKQAGGAGGQITQIVDELINSILGFPLLGNGPQGQGIPNDLYTFFGNLLDFLGGLDPLDPNFLANLIPSADPGGGSVGNFISTILHPTNLLAPLVDPAHPEQGLGLWGVVPLENLAIDAILAGVESVQELIDAILKTVGIPTGDVNTIFAYFTDLLKMFTHMDVTDANWWLDLASGVFDPVEATVKYITDILLNAVNPLIDPNDPLGLTHLLAPLVPPGLASGNFPVFGHVPIGNIPSDLISGVIAWGTNVAQDVQDVINSIIQSVITDGSTVVDGIMTDITWVLGNLPHGNILGNLGHASIGDTTQGILDGGIQAILGNPGSTGNSLADWYQGLNALTTHLGFSLTGPPPVNSITDITHTLGSLLGSRAVTKPVFGGVAPGADPVFPFSQLTGDAVPTQPVLLNFSTIGMIGTPDSGVKKSIEWYGGAINGTISCYLNVYLVDDATGSLTLVHASLNIRAQVVPSAFNYYNIPEFTMQTLTLGAPTGGSYNLIFDSGNGQGGWPTYAIAWNATAAVVRQALERLPVVGTGNVRVVGPVGGPFIITFINALAAMARPIQVYMSNLDQGLAAMNTFLVSEQGSSYAVELVVLGGGTYNIAALKHVAAVHSAVGVGPFPRSLCARRANPTAAPPATITDAVLDYTATAMPWFALCGESGYTQRPPLLITINATDTFDPKKYPWANYFDAAACGAGGGGRAGDPLLGGQGGQAGTWRAATYTKAQAGTTPWSITIGAGGAAGATTAAAGGKGGDTVIFIPGKGVPGLNPRNNPPPPEEGGPVTEQRPASIDPLATGFTAAGGAGGAALMGLPPGGSGAGSGNYPWPDFYGVEHTYSGGLGGVTPNSGGGDPGGGGGGGNAAGMLYHQYGGPGGHGRVYILAYQ